MNHQTPIIGSIPFYFQCNTLKDHRIFVERLNYIFEVNRIVDEETKKVILLTYIDGESYYKIKLVCGASDPPKGRTYDELLELLRCYTTEEPLRSLYGERRRFYEFRMDATHVVVDYARDIEYYAEQCRFQNGRDGILRDAFITGLRKELQTAFYELEPANMTYQDAVAIAGKAEIVVNLRKNESKVETTPV